MPQDAFLRQAIKRAAKKILRNVGVLRVDNDTAIGGACLDLLRTHAGRKQLEHEGLTIILFGEALLNEAIARHGLPDADAIAPKDEEGQRSLNLELFRTWVDENPLNDISRPAIAALLCAFAMWGEPAATTLMTELAEDDMTFRSLIEANPTPSEAIDDGEADEDTRVSSESDEADGSPSDESHSTDDVRLPDSTSEARSRPPEHSLKDWRLEIQRRRVLLEEGEQRLKELEALADTVRCEAAVVELLPWFRTPLDLARLSRVDDASTSECEVVRLTAAQTELARVMQAHTRAEALMERLGRKISPFIVPCSLTLAEIATRLDLLAQELALEAEEISGVIEISRTFLDQIKASDSQTAAVFCKNADLVTWSALARTLFDPTIATAEATQLRSTLATDELGGLLLARLAGEQHAAAINLVRWLFAASDDPDYPSRAARVFAFLSFTELCKIALDTPVAAEAAALLIFAASLRRDRGELLEHLTLLVESGQLDGITREFYRSLLSARHRGRLIRPASELRQSKVDEDQANASQADAEKVRQRLLLSVTSTPGLRRTFHRLRVYAQVQFLQPLRASIEKRDPATARRLWQSFGGVEAMVEACIGLLKAIDKPEARHYERTRAYIHEFGLDLERWIILSSSSLAGRDADLSRAFQALHEESPRNPASAAVASVAEAGERVAFPTDDFAERLRPDGRVQATGPDIPPWITPTMLASWPRFFTGSADLGSAIADTLRIGLLVEQNTLDGAVETYLAAGELEAALRASQGKPGLFARVEAVLGERRQALLALYEALLNEAEKASDSDLLVAEYLSSARAALAENDFAEANAAFELLGDAVSQYRQQQDPTRQSLIAWLSETGRVVKVNVSTRELTERADACRSEAAAQRLHIRALVDAASHTRAAEPVQAHWAEAARRLDRPSFLRRWDSQCLTRCGMVAS